MLELEPEASPSFWSLIVIKDKQRYRLYKITILQKQIVTSTYRYWSISSSFPGLLILYYSIILCLSIGTILLQDFIENKTYDSGTRKLADRAWYLIRVDILYIIQMKSFLTAEEEGPPPPVFPAIMKIFVNCK